MLPPGPSAPPLVQTLRWLRAPVPLFEECRERYGPTFTLRLKVGAPIVCLTDPAHVKELFTAPPDVLHPGEGGRILEPILGSHSVLVLDEDAHLEQRRMMLPAFHGDRMTALTEALEELTARAVDELPRDEPVALHPRMQLLTLRVILRAIFGLRAGPRLERFETVLTDYLERGSAPVNMLPALQRDLGPRSPWGRFLRVRREALALLHEEIRARRADRDHDGDDVLAMLLGARHGDAGGGRPMADDEIADELMTLLVAGHETTASQLAWTFERLARTPDVLATAVRAADAGDDAYLTAVLNEGLRMRPVLLFAQPRAVHRDVELGGRRYTAGTCAITANVYLIHHDPEIYPQPHRFRPERFLERPPGTYTFVPFGGGRRRCLGMSFAMLEMRIVLRELLRRRTVQAVGDGGEGPLRRHITVSPARGGLVVLGDRGGYAARAAQTLATSSSSR